MKKPTTYSLIPGDIIVQVVDAIVNAANSSLLGGGGVDGAIHMKAGYGLLGECRTLGGCEVGQAKITKGYRLPAKFVIHTVAPICDLAQGLSLKDTGLLSDCYINSLKLAMDKGLKTIAFPNLGTGIYRFPKPEACQTAINSVREFVLNNPKAFNQITFVCFEKDNYELYKKYFQKSLNLNPTL